MVVAGTVCDTDYSSAHMLVQGQGEPFIGGVEAGQGGTCPAGTAGQGGGCGFATFYSDTLFADGTKATHNCAGSGDTKTGGAHIGVVNGTSTMIGPARGTEAGIDYSALAAADGDNFFKIQANGVDGFTRVRSSIPTQEGRV